MRLAYSKRSGDLHPKAPLFITKVCVFGFCNPWSGFGQAPSHCLLHKQLPFEMLLAHKLNEAQLCRVLHYCRSRRHPLRNTTIFLVSFYAGLRAKEITALKLGDVFDEAGNMWEQFILGAEQSKCRQRRTVWLNQHLEKRYTQIRGSCVTMVNIASATKATNTPKGLIICDPAQSHDWKIRSDKGSTGVILCLSKAAHSQYQK